MTRCTPVDELPELITVAELAAFLGIGRSLAYELIRTGHLSSVRLGRLVRVPRSALVAMTTSAPAHGARR